MVFLFHQTSISFCLTERKKESFKTVFFSFQFTGSNENPNNDGEGRARKYILVCRHGSCEVQETERES